MVWTVTFWEFLFHLIWTVTDLYQSVVEKIISLQVGKSHLNSLDFSLCFHRRKSPEEKMEKRRRAASPSLTGSASPTSDQCESLTPSLTRFCPDQRVGVRNIWLSWSDPLSAGQKNLLSMVTARGQRSRSPCVRRDHWKTPTGLRTCSPKTSWRKGPATPTRTSVLSRNVSRTLPGPPTPFLTTVFLIFYQKMKKKNCFFFSSAKYIKCEQCGNPKVGSTRVILQYQTAGSRLFF